MTFVRHASFTWFFTLNIMNFIFHLCFLQYVKNLKIDRRFTKIYIKYGNEFKEQSYSLVVLLFLRHASFFWFSTLNIIKFSTLNILNVTNKSSIFIFHFYFLQYVKDLNITLSRATKAVNVIIFERGITGIMFFHNKS